MIEMVTNDAIIKAAKRLKGKIVRTPLLKSDHVNKELKSNIYIKAENLQTIGAFKFRGAMNTILQLPPDVKKVVAWSSGNHAQAVAAAANITEREATIVMPKDSPKTKLNGTIAWGAKIVEYDRNTENREEIGKAIAKEQNAIIIPPFDDVNVIIGQGTAGLEAVEQLKEINVIPDIVLCCCGGGGLIAGVSTSIKANYPNAQIYSVEPENFDDTKKSLEADMIVENTMQHLSICDALLANKPGNITFEINRKNLSGGISISDTESLIAMKIAYKYFKIVLEPGGAVALAAAISKKIDIKNKNVLVIASGGNVDSDIFEKCLYAESF
ncbi:threonine/serine dehydratase [Alphaproteobacteria bacterium]|jgi:threonine dehydratase|nr:threonine/serine dehydratase [Alphaproteobacteria bacterium]